jgi:hypothetical protein
MFVRKKPNKSGVVSIQVIDKSSGKYKVRKTIGSSADPLQVDRLVVEAERWIKHYKGEIPIDFEGRRIQVEYFLDHISELSTCGVGMLLGRIFDEMGFNQIDSPLFRPLVLTRIEYPVSKLKTTDYWFKYHNTSVDVVKIYRYLDRLHKYEKEAIQGISYQHTQKILGGEIKIVFYDVTTIYFEAEREDDLRKNGFSKDGKHQNPQIVLGLLVSDGGYPLAYDIFEGNKYEGETMLPIIDAFKERYEFEQLTIVADAGLINHQNIEELSQRSYPYILGARIKNESGTIKKNILSLSLKDGQYKMIKKDDNTTLIISYSKARARKDRHNRERGLKKLEKQLSSGKLTKANINNRGYNKYLKLEGEVKIEIDKEKFALAAILSVGIMFESDAQSNWEVGLRFGDPTVAIDATIPLAAAPRLHPAIYMSDNFGIGTYFDWMFALSGGPQGLKFYPGVGPEFWFGDDFDFVVAGDFGAEYSFDFPLTVFFDWRPGFVVTDGFNFRGNNIGVGARFRFGEGVSFQKTN